MNFEELAGRPGKKGSISIEQIRRDVESDCRDIAEEGKYKVYLIWHSDSMTIEAQNAILKTLEEAPEHVIILLLAKDATRLLPTVLSRVVRVFVGEMDYREALGDTHAESDSGKASSVYTGNPSEEPAGNAKICRGAGTVDGEDLFCFLDIILRDVLCYKCSKDTTFIQQKLSCILWKWENDIPSEPWGSGESIWNDIRKESCIMCRVPCS